MAVRFYLRDRIDRNNESAIRVSVSMFGQRLMTYTGLNINPRDWNAARQRAKKSAGNNLGMSGDLINLLLGEVESHFNELEINCMKEQRSVTREDLLTEFNEVFKKYTFHRSKNDRPDAFWAVYDKFISENSVNKQWTTATRQKFNALKVHLRRWSENINFGSLGEEGLSAFVVSLRDKEMLLNSTIMKQVGFLKWFLRWADSKGYPVDPAYKIFSPKLKSAKKKVVFLEWDELMKVFNLQVPASGTTVTLHRHDGTPYVKVVERPAAMAIARDIFCFCSFTSLRYSDAVNLKKSDIGPDSFTITTIKTNDTITIELNKYSRAILERYADLEGERALPQLSNQKMNQAIKDVCELCEINTPVNKTYYRGNQRIEESRPKFECIGTHTGRRSFICNALMLGIPAQVVMEWTGHSDYKSMKPYIEIANSFKQQAMKIFDSR